MRLIALALIVISFMGGCGVHLRGTSPPHVLPFKCVVITPDDPFDPVYRQLRHSLKSQKIQVISQCKPCSEGACINIVKHHFTEQPFVYAPDGEIRREKLFFELKYSYNNTCRTIVVQRFWQININQNLGSIAEKETIKREMIADAISQLLVQLNVL